MTKPARRYRYNVEVDDLGVEYADSGRFRSYSMETFGDNVSDMIDNAHVFEVDQDGGSLNDYPLTSRGGEVYRAGVAAIEAHVESKLSCPCTADAFCFEHRPRPSKPVPTCKTEGCGATGDIDNSGYCGRCEKRRNDAMELVADLRRGKP